MAANHEGMQPQDSAFRYSPEANPACERIYKAYGKCCGPCDGPCYIVRCAHYLPGCPDCKADGQFV